ncbi:chemotaxis protein CheB [Legionella anisa]|uniref:CheB-type methylesterase domain-containing protein n=1 Tax=Legionella anisa TaxID=28082 RepID=A0AAX0WW58_9GAMM|nr:chemotaxis protein CheB [Legionella anisa]AWN73560.1 hypothetical protein DLD14_06715 [Legionella anisa]KTC68532.1 chemotaxis-specific methylesterase [Legionella anisa]MBN5935299.1 hypothetical protein [Legionella anisa]MCW8426439.1 hypothetical protein [Legionella anisa]MCW8448100.1 hypothetical protein [Legionella anisa]
MFKNYVTVIEGSAGAINALECLLNPLPTDFPATILIVVHLPPTPISRLPKVISRFNRIYVAP